MDEFKLAFTVKQVSHVPEMSSLLIFPHRYFILNIDFLKAIFGSILKYPGVMLIAAGGNPRPLALYNSPATCPQSKQPLNQSINQSIKKLKKVTRENAKYVLFLLHE